MDRSAAQGAPDLDVLGIGYACLDELLLLNRLPAPEEHALILQRSQQGGGMVATAMVAVARLGGRAGMVTVTGTDPIGTAIMDEFVAYGVDVSRSVRQPGATSHKTVVLVDRRTAGRTFLSQQGTVRPVAVTDLDRDYVTAAAALLLAEAGPSAQAAARWAKAAGRVVCLDGTHFRPAVAALAPHVDYLIASQLFAREFVAYQEAGADLSAAAAERDIPGAGGPPSIRAPLPAPLRPPGALTGERLAPVAQAIRRLGSGVAVVTDGDRGSWCATAGDTFHIPAFTVQAVDTTGAGDVFHGAFLVGITRDWELRRSLTFASAVAALKCRALGGRTGIPSMDEALAFTQIAGDGQPQ